MNKLGDNKQSYGRVSKWLHWGMALMLVVMISGGTYVAGLDQSDPSRLKLLGMHKSFGMIFMQLTILRLIWSRISRPPQLPDALADWEKRLSRIITGSLYILMVAIPFSGFALTNFAGYPVSFFGLVDMPQMFEKNINMAAFAREAHGLLVYTLLLALFAHIAGVLKHRYMDSSEADVLHRMLPLKLKRLANK